MKKIFALTVCAWMATTASAQVVIDVDAAKRGPKIRPTHYGIFFEDINHAADGGLYAELIRNRSFEDGEDYGKPANMEAWSVKGGVVAKLIQPTKKVKLLNSAQGNALQLTVDATEKAPACLVNDGYWGIKATSRQCSAIRWVRKSMPKQWSAISSPTRSRARNGVNIPPR